jgi:hypothetical protein
MVRPPSDEGRIHLALTRLGGDTVYARQMSIGAARVSQSQMDSARTARLAALRPRSDPGEAASMDSILRRDLAWHRNPLEGIIAGDDGSVLLQLSGAPNVWTFLLVRPGGQPAGTFTLPRDVEVQQVSGEMVYGVRWKPPYDVVRYRVR